MSRTPVAIASTLFALALAIPVVIPSSVIKPRISASLSTGAGGALGRGYGGAFSGGSCFGNDGALHFGGGGPIHAGGCLYGAIGRLSAVVPAIGFPGGAPSILGFGGGVFVV